MKMILWQGKRFYTAFFYLLIVLLLVSLTIPTGNAAQAKGYPEGSEKLLAQLQVVMPELPIQAVYKLPLAGMFGVELAGGQTLYGTADGQYFIAGDLYQLKDKIVNLAEVRRSVARKAELAKVPLEQMVVFSPAGETLTHVSVFTDVDCSFCCKLHLEMAELNERGVEVRYLAYPRAGIGTPTYAKMVSAWCADDPNAAITALKTGQSIPMKQCDNPISSHYELGRRVGVSGTPAIVTASGELLPGYMPAAELAAAIGLE
ncbi:MAG: DsbC family protein [Gammaproteobacteria bacterium]|nr:DsbC family protein [Gammaproteobacteria bacterium]